MLLFKIILITTMLTLKYFNDYLYNFFSNNYSQNILKLYIYIYDGMIKTH